MILGFVIGKPNFQKLEKPDSKAQANLNAQDKII
jgi:hypothetical protein